MAFPPEWTGTRAVASSCGTDGTAIVIVAALPLFWVWPTAGLAAGLRVSSDGGGLAANEMQAPSDRASNGANFFITALIFFLAYSRGAAAVRSRLPHRHDRASPRPRKAMSPSREGRGSTD